MSSPVLRASACALALLGSACGERPAGLSAEVEPLAVLHVRLEGALLETPCHPRLGLLWAAVPTYIPYCHTRGPTPLDPAREPSTTAAHACRDPFRVTPALAGPSVAIDLRETSFELPIVHLPNASIMVGDAGARVAYAAVILYDDLDGDGELTFTRCRGNTRGGGPTTPSRPFDCGSTSRFERIHAASFERLDAESTRVTYVEGPFDAGSYFYPHPGCTALPPGGFSVWRTGALLSDTATCDVSPIDTEIVLTPRAPDALVDLTCPQRRRDAFPRPPTQLPDAEELSFECDGEGGIATTDLDCPCPNLRTYTLRGCYEELECSDPDWDVPAPEAWPCTAP